MTTWEQENESERKKEPEIPRHRQSIKPKNDMIVQELYSNSTLIGIKKNTLPNNKPRIKAFKIVSR